MEGEQTAMWSIKPQTVNDIGVSGLILKFETIEVEGEAVPVLYIYRDGDALVNNRDFSFSPDGHFGGAGSGVGLGAPGADITDWEPGSSEDFESVDEIEERDD